MPHTSGVDPPPEQPTENDLLIEPVEVPHTLLSPDALLGLVESFILREGTDYGAREFTHEQKVAQVMAQLARGDVRIVFDPETESVTLLVRER